MLLSQFKPDIEQEGDVKFDGYLIEGASPLWCAAGMKIKLFSLFKNTEIEMLKINFCDRGWAS